jgi:thiamine-monophosphate kinase
MNKKETELINNIKNKINYTNPNVIKGIGDDCAVLEYSKDLYEIVSTDILAEGIHFDLDEISIEDVGYKAMACNISDIASMGGYPETALVSLCVPDKFSSKDIDFLYKGLNKSAGMFDVSIVGGDISKSKNDFIINVCIIGKVEKDKIVYRSGAKDKDLIFVTGALGASRVKKHYSFIPRVAEARELALNNIPTAMIDLSDGVGKDLKEILISSKINGAVIEKDLLPISKDCKQEKIKHVFCDGEDYELLFTVNPFYINKLKEFSFEYFKIGYIDKNLSGIFLKNEQEIISVNFTGYEHF